MVSITSLVVLLLATYCYSIPIGQSYDASTSNYEFSTGKTMVPRGSEPMDMNDEETTTVDSVMNHKRGDDDHSDEMTTERYMGEKPKRVFTDDYLFTTAAHDSKSPMFPKRSFGDDFEATTERYMEEKPKRSNGEDDHSDEMTTENYMEEKPKRVFTDDYSFTTAAHDSKSPLFPKRSFGDDDEATTERYMKEKPKRSNGEDDHSDEMTTENYMEEKPKRVFTDDYSFTTAAHISKSPMFPKRSFGNDDDHSDELTTERQFDTDAEYPKRETVESFYATSEEPHHIRSFGNEFFPTMESSTEFNSRVSRFQPVDSDDKKTHDAHFTDMEKTSTFEPVSSGESFGKSTGFLHQEPMQETFTTSRYDNERFPSTEQRITKTETIIPGRIIETKIYSGLPSRTSVVEEPMTPRPTHLSQGETNEHDSKPMSNH